MRKWSCCKTVVILTLLTVNNAVAQKLQLKKYRSFPHYASASDIAWHKGKLYVMGDDAPTLLILNRRLKEKAQIKLFNYNQKRIPYAEKHDIEAATILQGNTLWLLPSFSAAARNKAVLINLKEKEKKPQTHTLSLGTSGIANTNIEGAAMLGEKLLLANRANSQSPGHYLLLYDFKNRELAQKPERTYTLTLPPTKATVGISGLHYAAQKDVLLMTVSTEMTRSATADGAIGDSYLAIINNASRQLNGSNLKADSLIDLTPILGAAKPMKIESVTVRKISGNKLLLFLAADNDDGTSHLFLISVKLPR